MANGHRSVAEHLMEKTDRAVLGVSDRHGRSALHYAAGVAADNEEARDMYDWLVEYGANERKIDEVN